MKYNVVYHVDGSSLLKLAKNYSKHLTGMFIGGMLVGSLITGLLTSKSKDNEYHYNN